MESYLGIDVGSVTTKFAVLNAADELLASLYLPTGGRPVAMVQQGLRQIGRQLPPDTEIRGVAATGSARYLPGTIVGADLVKHEITWQLGHITLPEIIELGAMKAYALGRRSKWKDYVDLHFLLKFKLSMEELIEKAKEIFSSHFNSKLFREQLCYFDDIDYSEAVEYMDYAPSDKEVREFLAGIAVRI